MVEELSDQEVAGIPANITSDKGRSLVLPVTFHAPPPPPKAPKIIDFAKDCARGTPIGGESEQVTTIKNVDMDNLYAALNEYAAGTSELIPRMDLTDTNVAHATPAWQVLDWDVGEVPQC